MVPNVEDVDEVVVGRRYLVPTVIRKWGVPKRFAVVPIIGPLHEDAQFINFPDRHWHPDRRFLSDAWFRSGFSARSHWAVVYIPEPKNYAIARLRGVQLEVTDQVKERGPSVVDGGRRVMVCKRLIESFVESSGKPPQWLRQMEQVYKKERLRKMICPHRGISCVGVKPESDGGIVCPGHGLKWNQETGQLISRFGSYHPQPNLFH